MHTTALPPSLRDPVQMLSNRPGKGLRCRLLAGCAAFGSPPDGDRLVRLGALVELVHLASLLHDDVVDRAPTRRGAPAAHTVVGREHALLAGLGCLALVGSEAAEMGGGLDVLVSRTVAGLASGQIRDLERAFDTTLDIFAYLELVKRKTGALFSLSCLLGAAEAGVSSATGRALGLFGVEFGIAYQILDDCLDLRTSEIGKPTGIDHMLGLFGAPTLYALRRDTSGELARLVLSPEFGWRDLARVREMVADLDGIATATDLAREHYGAAVQAVDGLPSGPLNLLLSVASVDWTDGG